MSTSSRKRDHVDLTVNHDVGYTYGAGFDRVWLRHNALPELDFDEIDTGVKFLGRGFGSPLFISSMTGGFHGSESINGIFAELAEEFNIPMGVGSQRIIWEDPASIPSFAIARKRALKAFISANIGGVQLRNSANIDRISELVEVIAADAIIIHLNPLQEMVQPEGDRRFSGVLHGIQQVCTQYQIPVIVKETGAGIDYRTAKKLIDAGVSAIDVAGAGGTSWAKVENLRRDQADLELFDDWGIPTFLCLKEYGDHQVDIPIIASGGIYKATDAVKAICMGARMIGVARPLIQSVDKGGMEAARKWILDFTYQLRMAMLLLGVKETDDLSSEHLIFA